MHEAGSRVRCAWRDDLGWLFFYTKPLRIWILSLTLKLVAVHEYAKAWDLKGRGRRKIVARLGHMEGHMESHMESHMVGHMVGHVLPCGSYFWKQSSPSDLRFKLRARSAPVTKRHLLAESEYVRMALRSGRGVCGGLPRITELKLTFIWRVLWKLKQVYKYIRIQPGSPQLAVDPGAECKLCAQSVPVTKCDNVTC